MQRLREEAENAKIVLSSQTEVNINLPFLVTVNGEPRHMNITLTRSKFNEITKDLVDLTAGPLHSALTDAGLSASQLNKVILVGGSTRIPAVVDKVRSLTGKEPSKNLNPDECVALGASIQASKFDNTYSGYSKANEIVLMDVTPLSLSIETVGGVATKVIDRNTTIPTRQSQIFTTAANFQSTVEIKVYQGERQFARDNVLLGNFKLRGIKRAMAGIPQIEVSFDIDANGIVIVSAKDLATGKAQQITIESSSNLSDEDIERAMREAAAYEAADTAEMERLNAEAKARMEKAREKAAKNQARKDKIKGFFKKK